MPSTRTLIEAALAGAAGASLAILYAASRSRPAAEVPPPVPPPVLPEGRLVTVPGRGEIFFRDAEGPNDDAPVVVLLHGWMFPADLNWFTTFRPLSQVARVIAVDHRGHGRGMRPSAPFRLSDAADDVAALLRQLGTGPVVAVGYSMGGPIAQLLWRRHRDVVRGLVLCATAASFAESVRNKVLWHGMGLLQVALRVLPRSWWEALVYAQATGRLPFRFTRMINTDTSEQYREILPWIIGELDRNSAEDIAEAGRELSRFDARDWLVGVDVPHSVIVMSRDRIVPPADQRLLAARMPDPQIIELDLDHDAPAADADTFTAALRKAVEHCLDG